MVAVLFFVQLDPVVASSSFSLVCLSVREMAHTHICELICMPVYPWRPERAAGTLCITLYCIPWDGACDWTRLLPLLSTTLRYREPWPCLSFTCCWGFELRSVSLHSSLLWRRHSLLFLTVHQHPCLLSPCAATFQAASAEALIFPSVLSTAPIHEKTPKHMPGHLLSRPSCLRLRVPLALPCYLKWPRQQPEQSLVFGAHCAAVCAYSLFRVLLPSTFLLKTQWISELLCVAAPDLWAVLVPSQCVWAAASVVASAPSLPQITGPRDSVVTSCLWKPERDLSGYNGENFARKLRFDSTAGRRGPRMCILASSRWFGAAHSVCPGRGCVSHSAPSGLPAVMAEGSEALSYDDSFLCRVA